MPGYYVGITKYAQELLDDLELLKKWLAKSSFNNARKLDWKKWRFRV